MAGSVHARRLTLFLVLVFGATALGVLLQQPRDGVLRVEGWSDQILAAAEEAGLEDPFLLAGLVQSESRGLPDAVSVTGARGLCQVVPSTAAEMAGRLGIPGPPFAPDDNLRIGAHYLQDQIRRFDDVDLALLAFRIGPNAVRRRIDAAGSKEAWLDELKMTKPSPWDYRTQVLRFRDRFRERAEAGVAWSGSQAFGK